jgi:RAT1-interacting protein
VWILLTFVDAVVFIITLGRIFTFPYERRDGWALNVMLVGETLYLEEYLEPAQIQEK